MISERSYGSAPGVAGLVPRYANAGSFDGSTRPALITVEDWIDRVSAMLNITLKELGFSIPITVADGVLVLASFVEQEVASLVEAANNAGRFGPNKKGVNSPRGYWLIIDEEVTTFLEKHAKGLEDLGATRETPTELSLVFRETDDDGEQLRPMFTRKDFLWRIR